MNFTKLCIAFVALFSVMCFSNILPDNLFAAHNGNNQDASGAENMLQHEEIVVSTDEEFTITLDVNRTTGYDCRISYFPEMIELTNYVVNPPKSPEGRPMMGAPCQADFTFKLIESYPTTIKFIYERPTTGDISGIIVYRISPEGIN